MAVGRPADAVTEFFTAISDSPLPQDTLDVMGAVMAFRASGLIVDLECITGMDPDPNRWAAVTTPTLLLAGSASDSWGPGSIAMLEAVIPDSRMTLLEGLAHNPDDFAPVAAALREFLR